MGKKKKENEGYTINEIHKKRLCVDCDPSICHNNYNLCPYLYDKNIIKFCLTCEDLNNEIDDNGMLKCYSTCKYKTQKKMDKWF